MSPRPYRATARLAAAEETRRKIVTAAREVVAEPDGITSFTVDAVARTAGVSRMTVYHQFGSKAKLIEALFDDIARRGLVPKLRGALTTADPVTSFDLLIEAFAMFWTSDRLVIRRVRALTVLDPELGPSMLEREQWRRGLIRRALTRLATVYTLAGEIEPNIDAVAAMMSFASFDELSASERTPVEVAPIVRRQVYHYLGIKPVPTRRP
jgi:AcrR family transcriptional regulator